MSDPIKNAAKKNCITVSMDLPKSLIPRLDSLKSEWGLRGRGDVVVRLLEEIFVEAKEN